MTPVPPDPTPLLLPPRRRRRWLRLSLRGLMLLVLLIGVPIGWVANRIHTQRQAIATVRAAGGVILFDYQGIDHGFNIAPRRPGRTEPAAPRWLRRWLGDELFQHVAMVYFNEPVALDILATIARFDRLESLSINHADGGADESLHLRGLSRLIILMLDGEWVDDRILAEVAQLVELRQLILTDASGTDAGFARLAALPELVSLRISSHSSLTDANLTGPGVERLLEGMPRLRKMDLGTGEPLELTGMFRSLVRYHPDLEQLTIGRKGLTEEDLTLLERLTKLECLDLMHSDVTDAALAHLRPLRALKQLLVRGAGITDEGLKRLGQMPALEDVFLSGASITDAGLAHLAALPKLKRLVLGSAPGVTDAGLASVGRITSLEDLEINMAPGVTDAGLAALRGLAKLRILNLSQTLVTPIGVAALRQAIPSLRRVQISPISPAPSTPPR